MHLLEKENFLLLKNNMCLGQFSVDLLSKNQMSPKIMCLKPIDTALALVRQQYGVALASSFRLEEHANAKEIDVLSFGEDTEEWDFVAAYPADYNMKKPVRYLIDLMKGLYDI